MVQGSLISVDHYDKFAKAKFATWVHGSDEKLTVSMQTLCVKNFLCHKYGAYATTMSPAILILKISISSSNISKDN